VTDPLLVETVVLDGMWRVPDERAERGRRYCPSRLLVASDTLRTTPVVRAATHGVWVPRNEREPYVAGQVIRPRSWRWERQRRSGDACRLHVCTAHLFMRSGRLPLLYSRSSTGVTRVHDPTQEQAGWRGKSRRRGTERRPDVVVVGAGLAGLVATEELVGRGLDVVVLEARDRVGGRSCSRRIAGQAVDMGAEHVGPEHRRVLALAKRLGIRLEDSGLIAARARWQLGGTDKVGHLPPLSPRELASAVKVLARLALLCRRFPVDQPWAAPSAPMFDRISLADWFDSERLRGRARELHESMWQDGFAAEAERISMLHVLWTIRRSGGLVAGLRDALGYRLEGGTQSLALQLARRLGSRVELGRVVERIEQDEDEVSVVTDDGERREAAQAIVCVPVPTLRRIEFAPALPERLEQAHEELSFGRVTTIVVGAPSATDRGFGFVTGNERFGTAWRRGKTAKAKILDADPDAVAELTGEVARAFGLPATGLEAESVAWPDEPFTTGSYMNFAPGQLTRFGPHLRTPHGRIHFAAAERSSWPIFMEGAIESGSRAAAATLAA
jgi:monoamine oxidase